MPVREREIKREIEREGDSSYIEHCIIGEIFFITSYPQILGAFYNNEKNVLFIVIEQAISQ